MWYLPFCETSIDGHKTPTAKFCHAGKMSLSKIPWWYDNIFLAQPILTFFALPLSTCDKAITSPEHDFRVLKLSGWTITRFVLRDSPSTASDNDTVNLGRGICLVKVIREWTCGCGSERAVIRSESGVSGICVNIAGHSGPRLNFVEPESCQERYPR